jgi:hypothetical protein
VSKELIWKSYILLNFFGFSALSAIASQGENSLKKANLSALKPPRWSQSWSKKMQGAISELSVSRSGEVVLAATIPDLDLPGGVKTPLLLRLGKNGHADWQITLKSPVKEMDLSADGSLAVTVTYDHLLQAYSPGGQVLWSAPGLCKPMILNGPKKILCAHDDEAEPKIAFDVWDWKGKKLLSYPIEGDVFALKISPDEKWIALGLSNGEVLLLNSEFQLVSKKQLDGEVMDVALASSPDLASSSVDSSSGSALKGGSRGGAHLAVLYRDSEKNQKITLLDAAGGVIQTIAPSFKAQQLEVSLDGQAVYYYGNTSQGQWAGGVRAPFKQETWKRGEHDSSDYSAPIHVFSHGIWMGYEKHTDQQRESHILALNSQGEVSWDIAIPKSPEAYIYTHRPVSSPSGIVVATDDGRLSFFKLMN